MNRIAILLCSVLVMGCEPLIDSAAPTTTFAIVTPSVATSAVSYSPGQGVTVTWSGLPGNNLDWVDFAPVGSPLTTVTLRSYAGGRTVGEAAFQGTMVQGSYVARAFLDDSFTLLAESVPFVVGTCTGASLTAPTSAFAVGLGQPLALSATANCTAGVVPEFNFWTKQSGDANWNQVATGGYSTSSTGSFTAPTAGTWCTEVAVREQGSTVSSRARSASVCGAVVTGAPTFVRVAGGAFQFEGNTDPDTQVFAARVDGVPNGASITSGSVAVRCSGDGGGYFAPCTRLRETGTFQCGAVVACGTAASAVLPIATPFIVGPTAHLDVAFFGVAPALLPTTAVLTVLMP